MRLKLIAFLVVVLVSPLALNGQSVPQPSFLEGTWAVRVAADVTPSEGGGFDIVRWSDTELRLTPTGNDFEGSWSKALESGTRIEWGVNAHWDGPRLVIETVGDAPTEGAGSIPPNLVGYRFTGQLGEHGDLLGTFSRLSGPDRKSRGPALPWSAVKQGRPQ